MSAKRWIITRKWMSPGRIYTPGTADTGFRWLLAEWSAVALPKPWCPVRRKAMFSQLQNKNRSTTCLPVVDYYLPDRSFRFPFLRRNTRDHRQRSRCDRLQVCSCLEFEENSLVRTWKSSFLEQKRNLSTADCVTRHLRHHSPNSWEINVWARPRERS